jgi:hypothetical protein
LGARQAVPQACSLRLPIEATSACGRGCDESVGEGCFGLACERGAAPERPRDGSELRGWLRD